MNKFYALVGVAFALLSALPAAHAADAAAGQQQYQSTCAACHGSKGISVAPIYPNLAGQKLDYLVAQLQAFRDGTRVNPIMDPMAKNLSDVEIANLAAYLSTLKPQP